MRAISYTALLVFLMGVGGCAGIGVGEPKTVDLKVKPEWKTMVMNEYQFLIKLSLKSPASAQFPEPPQMIFAYYDPKTKYSHLVAVVKVDAQNTYGALLRDTCDINWMQFGNAELTPGRWDYQTTYFSNDFSR